MISLGRKLDESHPNTRQYGARSAILILSAINLVNFADRYVPSAVKELIIEDLHITDFESSLPTTGMVVVYMIFAVVFGTMNDKNVFDRRIILCVAIIFWSIFTSMAGLAKSLIQLICLRSLIGVGEAAYGTIAPPYVSDFFPARERNVAFGIYYLAIPIGGALGYGIGAILGSSFGWRIAFLAVGIPGILVAVSVLRLNDPVRGINDREPTDNRNQHDCEEIGIRESEYSPYQAPLISTTNQRGGEGEGEYSKEKEGDVFNMLLSPTLSSELTAAQIASQPHHPHSHPHSSSDSLPSLSTLTISPHQSITSIDHPSQTTPFTTTHTHTSTHTPPLTWSEELSVSFSEVREILSNKHYLSVLVGWTLNNFALGGLAEWMATFMLRYQGASLSSAGLVVGAATVIGGIGGNLLGAKLSDYYAPKIKSAHFLVPGLFTIPSALFLAVCINIENDFLLSTIFLFLGQICVWTSLAPINNIQISVIPPRLRARSCGMVIFFQHMLGDIISPPIIGAISDSTGSLRFAMQITWITVILSGLSWLFGWAFLSPLNLDGNSKKEEKSVENREQEKQSRDKLFSGEGVSSDIVDSEPNPTFRDVLLSPGPLTMVDGKIVHSQKIRN